MKYEISKATAPAMPNLGASKDMYEPLVPMLFPSLGEHICGAEFLYSDRDTLLYCRIMLPYWAIMAG